MNNISIVKAQSTDLPRLMEIYAYARNFMRENGNPAQWENLDAIERNLVTDIEHENLYLIRDDENIHGAFALIIGDDPTYADIEGGEWLSDEEYGTIHRVASDGKIHGLMGMIVRYCNEKINHLRIDTHEDNKIMQHLILKNGFSRRGIIYVADGTPRIAYEKLV